MRHGNKINHLGRKAPHRKAMLSNMASSLILHKRITTTLAKAKALRKYAEPLLTKSKEDSTHNRRTVFSHLQDKNAVAELFRTVSPKIQERNGGYTRIIKLGNRLGDAAEMAMIELVDFNELMLQEAKPKKTSTRRRGVKKKTDAAAPVAQEEAPVVEETPAKTEEVKTEKKPKAEAKIEEAPVVEETPAETEEVKTEKKPKAEAKTEEAPVVEASAEEAPTTEANTEESPKEEEKPSDDEEKKD
jgi:large subunit ribosomal protein L17